MPLLKLNAKRLKTKVRKFSLVISLLSLVMLFSGCSAVSSNKPAALQVTSTPEAAVFLDGKHLGKTPFFSDQLRSGEYLLKLSASDASFVEKITLTGSTLTVVNRELSANFLAQSGEVLYLQPKGRGLLVVSAPSEAELTIDGKFYGQTPAQVENIEEGEHKVSLVKDGYITREFTIKTSGKYQLIASVTLASEIAKSGKLPTSPTPPPTAKVEVVQTPQGFLRVRADPSLTAPEIGRVKTGDKLEVIQEVKDWIKVSFEGKQGWISAQYTKKL